MSTILATQCKTFIATVCADWLMKVWTDPDGVGQCERHGQRQPLWNSDDEDGDSDDEEPHELLQMVDAPRLLLDDERLD